MLKCVPSSFFSRCQSFALLGISIKVLILTSFVPNIVSSLQMEYDGHFPVVLLRHTEDNPSVFSLKSDKLIGKADRGRTIAIVNVALSFVEVVSKLCNVLSFIESYQLARFVMFILNGLNNKF